MEFTRKNICPTFLRTVLWLGVMTCWGCGTARPNPTPTVIPGEVYTQVAATIIAEITQTAADMPTNTPTEQPLDIPSPTASPLAVAPTLTPTLTPTETPVITATQPVTASSTISGTLTPPSMSTPTATEMLDVAYFDDFSENTGWFTINAADHKTDYYQGGYRIQIDGAETPIWSTRKRNYPDVHLGVDASLLSGSMTGYFGLICRQQEGGGYYGLVISGDGTYGIGKSHGGSFTFLQQGKDVNGAIKNGYAMNRISADCTGDTLALFANDIKLLEVQDTEFTAGYIGLLVGTRSEANVAVLFDNFGAVKR
jgi:hypothetical protein